MKCIDTTYFVDLIRRPSAIRTITQKLDEGVCMQLPFSTFMRLYLVPMR